MRTSVDLPDALLRKAKLVAHRRGTTLRALILEGLRGLVEGERSPRPHRLKDRSFRGDGLVEGLSANDWGEILSRGYEGRSG